MRRKLLGMGAIFMLIGMLMLPASATYTQDPPPADDLCHKPVTQYRYVKQVKKNGEWKPATGAVAYDSGWVDDPIDVTNRPGGPWTLGEPKKIGGQWFRYIEKTRDNRVEVPCPTTPTTVPAPTTSSTTDPGSTTTTVDPTTTTVPEPTTSSTTLPPSSTTTTLELIETHWDASATCSTMTSDSWGEGMVSVGVFSMDHLGVPQTEVESSTFTFSGETKHVKVASPHLFTLVPTVEPGFVAVPEQIELKVYPCDPEDPDDPGEPTTTTTIVEECTDEDINAGLCLPYTGMDDPWTMAGFATLLIGFGGVVTLLGSLIKE